MRFKSIKTLSNQHALKEDVRIKQPISNEKAIK